MKHHVRWGLGTGFAWSQVFAACQYVKHLSSHRTMQKVNPRCKAVAPANARLAVVRSTRFVARQFTGIRGAVEQRIDEPIGSAITPWPLTRQCLDAARTDSGATLAT